MSDTEGGFRRETDAPSLFERLTPSTAANFLMVSKLASNEPFSRRLR
jgi:hypothetical protein